MNRCKLLCLGRGIHPPVLLGFSEVYVSFWADPTTGRPYGRVRRFESFRGRLEIVTAPDGHRTVHLRCPQCGRHVQWREEHAVERVNRRVAAGSADLDISDT